MPGFSLGGIFTTAFSDAVAATISLTALFGGAARYAAVLVNRTKEEVERATAYGFFFGFWLGAVVLLIDFTT